MTERPNLFSATLPRSSRRRFVKTLLCACGSCLGASLGIIPHGAASPDGDRVLAALKNGGCVVYIRHAQTDRSRDDVLQPDLNDCTTQRLLSTAGEKQAADLGLALRSLGIRPGQIFSSPYCRTLETARRAFPGRAIIKVSELGRLGRTITNKIPTSCARLKQLLSIPPTAGEITIIVGHSDNLAAVGGPDLDEAGLAVFRSGNNAFELVGTLNPPQWAGIQPKK